MMNRRSAKVINMDFHNYHGSLERQKVDSHALADFRRKPYNLSKEMPSERVKEKAVAM